MEPWRDAVGWAWKIVPAEQRSRIVNRPCYVEMQIAFSENRRRDPHNYVDTVVKAVVDQLVKQGVWPGDDPRWVKTAEPTLVVGDECKVRLILR